MSCLSLDKKYSLILSKSMTKSCNLVIPEIALSYVRSVSSNMLSIKLFDSKKALSSLNRTILSTATYGVDSDSSCRRQMSNIIFLNPQLKV